MENQGYNEFSMRELFFFLKKKLWILVVLAVIGVLGGYIWGKVFVTPSYTAESQIYIYQKNNDMNYTGLQVATQLRRDCEILMAGRNVTVPVVEALDLKMNPDSLGRRIKVSTVENTRVMNIAYSDTDPQRAAEILNTVCLVAKEELEEIMGAENTITILYQAETPTAPSTQGARHYAMMGGAGALVVALILLVVFFLVDDTIHSEVDVERFLELPTLAAIPASRELGDGSQRSIGRKIGGLFVGKKR